VKKTILTRFASVTFMSLLAAGTAFAAPGGGQSESEMNNSMRVGDVRSPMLPEIGISGGGATQNGDLYKTDPAFGVEVGASPWGPFALALQAQHEPSSLDVPLGHFDFNTTNVVLKETVGLGSRDSILNNFFIGTKTGVAIYSGDVDTKTNLAVGGTLGFDVPLTTAHQVSLGAEGTYLAVLGGSDNNRTPDQTSVLGSMKYWF
jgi:hypothetical protein